MMVVELKINGEITPYAPTAMSIRCPACRQIGSFHGIGQNDIVWVKQHKADGKVGATSTKVGIRQCPNLACREVVFFGKAGSEKITYPPETIDFDATNLPTDILASFDEAVRCHAAGCFRASALLIRRTLEELCDDKQATGKDLKARISALSAVAIVPNELLNAADELRLLGNDAAHIEAKSYDAIGENEAALAIELTKELLKAVYQYTSLLTRLQAMKKAAP